MGFKGVYVLNLKEGQFWPSVRNDNDEDDDDYDDDDDDLFTHDT